MPSLDFLKQKILSFRIAIAAAGCIVALVVVYALFLRAPSNFPDTAVVTIPTGASLSAASQLLKENNIIRSKFWLINSVIFLKHERKVVGGQYYFERPMNVFRVARRITKGDYHINQLKTTIPEGSTIFDISLIVKKHYPQFDTVHFVTLARDKEGYLFPDTYHLGADVTPERVVDMLTSTFNKKIEQAEVKQSIEAFDRPIGDIVTMASILEGEARQMRTRQIIAGILWERLRLGIPLQVDAAFRYVNGKTSEQLTASDLKIKSPYNTYMNKGLPPTPISSPGLDSIMAAVTPIRTDYLYFLTDKDGNMHYAKTLDEHAANKRKYLK